MIIIHRVPDLFATLRGLIDQGRRRGHRTGRFLILGSASVELLRQSGESLAGHTVVGTSSEGFVIENLSVDFLDMMPLRLLVSKSACFCKAPLLRQCALLDTARCAPERH
jgi:hypothetical protein